VALLVAAAVLVVVAPSASAARVRPGFVGIQAWDTPSAPEFARLAAGRIGLYRTNILWSVVEYQPGARNWGPYDQLIFRAASARMRVVPVLLGSPRFAARKFQYPPRSARNKKRWAAFVRDVVRRYGRRGTFWRQNPTVPYKPITAWQVWNEPNFRGYWNGHPSARGYVRFLKLSRRAIKKADPRAKIVLAGLPETRLGVPGHLFLPKLYRARARRLFDVISLHAYARNSREVLKSVKLVRSIMRRYGDGRKQLWITELGWATGGKVSKGTRKFKTSKRGQAARLRGALRAVLRARRRYRIGMFIWFSWRDRPPLRGERNWWAINTGLFTRAGLAKPAWSSYTKFTGGVPGPKVPLGVPPGGGGGGGPGIARSGR
jgi:polysaccharide biosynthesis protein PslG